MKNKSNRYRVNWLLSVALVLTIAVAAGAQAKPDLIITNATMTMQKRANTVYQFTFTITVANYCNGTTAGEHSLFLNMIGDDASYSINQNVPSLKGGQSHTMTVKINRGEVGGPVYFRDLFFKWVDKSGSAPKVLIKLDTADKVKEANENNNWRWLNPNEEPSKLSGQFQCSPKV